MWSLIRTRMEPRQQIDERWIVLPHGRAVAELSGSHAMLVASVAATGEEDPAQRRSLHRALVRADRSHCCVRDHILVSTEPAAMSGARSEGPASSGVHAGLIDDERRR